jgi:hypothetical protein
MTMEIVVDALQLLGEQYVEESLYPCTWTCNSDTCDWTTCSLFVE